MAQSSTFAGSEAFALGSCITFDTLDFLSIGELHLSAPSVPTTTGLGLVCSTRSKVEKWRLKRRTADLKRRLNQHTAITKQGKDEVPPSTLGDITKALSEVIQQLTDLKVQQVIVLLRLATVGNHQASSSASAIPRVVPMG